MESPVKIAIVEDEMVIAANISLQLSTLGYEVTGIIPRGEEALRHMKQNRPDIVLMDIQLKGEMDGIETARRMQQEYDIAVIYLTANGDDHHFEKAKATHPYAFISKPFKNLDIQRAVELTISHIRSKEAVSKEQHISPFILSNCIFVRNNEKLVKVPIENILYVEAERNYCRIHTSSKEYLLVITLKDLDEKLPAKHFLRIHRSFIVNISQIDELANSHVVIAKKAIPISKPLKDELLNRLQTI